MVVFGMSDDDDMAGGGTRAGRGTGPGAGPGGCCFGDQAAGSRRIHSNELWFMVLTVQQNRRYSDAHAGFPCLRRCTPYAMALSSHGGGF